MAFGTPPPNHSSHTKEDYLATTPQRSFHIAIQFKTSGASRQADRQAPGRTHKRKFMAFKEKQISYSINHLLLPDNPPTLLCRATFDPRPAS